MNDSLEKENNITLFAETNFRNKQVKFGIKRDDRRAHMYLIGKTGTGKSTLLETLIQQDIASGQGLALLDPHGDLVEKILAQLPEHRKEDLIYFNVPDHTQALSLNPLESIAPLKRPLAASGLLEVFKKLWLDSWGPRLEHIMRNALLAMFDQPQATLADVLRLLEDQTFRKEAVTQIKNAQVRNFWAKE